MSVSRHRVLSSSATDHQVDRRVSAKLGACLWLGNQQSTVTYRPTRSGQSKALAAVRKVASSSSTSACVGESAASTGTRIVLPPSGATIPDAQLVTCKRQPNFYRTFYRPERPSAHPGVPNWT
jgi:hypothetical protein